MKFLFVLVQLEAAVVCE